MKTVSIAAGLALATVSFVALLGAETIPTPRMPYSESSAIKRQMLQEKEKEYKNKGYTMFCMQRDSGKPCTVKDFELDHIIPLCLGGSNNSSNLQLQLWAEAKKKDKLEILSCKMVRAGRLNIDAARSLFTNWRASYKEVFGNEP